MAQYLRIENNGECCVDAFRMLGVSTARNDSESIGQFGSGAKHGILLALRNGLDVWITSGRKRIHATTETRHSESLGSYQALVFIIDGRRIETSMSLGFGELDWDDMGMAIREFVSNALDASGQKWESIGLDFVDNVRAKAGTTRVFVECNSAVRKYINDINDYFLHPMRQHQQHTIQREVSSCKLYRLGVLVRENSESSLLDYNDIDGALPIDESRNLDSYRMRSHCANILCQDAVALRYVIKQLATGNYGDELYEHGFSRYSLSSYKVAEALKFLYGENVYVTDNDFVFIKAKAKGNNVVMLPSGYASAAISGDIPDAKDSLTKGETRGETDVDVSDECVATVREVWSLVELADMHSNKACPSVRCFVSHMESNAQCFGYWDSTEPDTIHLHADHATNRKTILEEIAHYVTGAADETRDFQDYLLRLLIRIAF